RRRSSCATSLEARRRSVSHRLTARPSGATASPLRRAGDRYRKDSYANAIRRASVASWRSWRTTPIGTGYSSSSKRRKTSTGWRPWRSPTRCGPGGVMSGSGSGLTFRG
ncbi:unnamed protein product, partial [Symbiodinium sp. CCMP2456]